MRTKVFCLVLVIAVALPSSALAAVRFTKINYNSPGNDTGSNSSLNAEYVVIKNTGTQAKIITGWKVRDVAGHVFRFGKMRLGAGRSVTVHTGSGAKRPGHRYWGQNNYVWNNDRDTATLRTKNGSVRDRCSYNNSSASSTFC